MSMMSETSLLDQIRTFYQTNSREEINKIWSEIDREDHLRISCDYKEFLNDKSRMKAEPYKHGKLVIISPGYNCERYLDLWYNSLAVQNYKDWICFAIDDLSTDGTWDKLKQLAKIDNRIIPLRSTMKHYQLANWYNIIHGQYLDLRYELGTKSRSEYDSVAKNGVPNNSIIIFHDLDDWFGTKYAFELAIKEFAYRDVICLTARNFQLSDYYNHDGKLYTNREDLIDLDHHEYSLFAYKAYLFKNIPDDHFTDPSTGKFYTVCGDMAITNPILYQAGPEHHQHLFVDNFIIYNDVRLECDKFKYEESGETKHRTAQLKLAESFQRLVSEGKLRTF